MIPALLLGAVSLVLLAFAAARWPAGNVSDGDAPPRAGFRGGVILFAVSFVSVGALWAAAAWLSLDRDRVLWTGVGTLLGVMTLTRPWWFWENAKARWLRGLIGDDATALFYLAVATVMVLVGLFTNWTFGRR